MTQIDSKALDIATETLRPLLREPVTYLKQAARDSIAAYLAALPPPAGDVGELMLRVAVMADAEASAETVKLIVDLRDALQSLSALLPPAGDQQICDRLAQIRREHAQEIAALSARIALEIRTREAATARAERAEAALRTHGSHLISCSTGMYDRGPCDCGLAAALSPAPAGGEDGWRDIASAPKDGTEFLVWSDQYDTPTLATIRDGEWFVPDVCPHGWTELVSDPTHWRPLPASPAKGARDE
jgi:hypothetical protein